MEHGDEAARWAARYRSGGLPWDTGEPEPVLVSALADATIAPGRVLEVGCGTGTNSVWLAQRGFDVTACDIAPAALELARAKAVVAGVAVDWREGSFPEGEDGRYDLVFDRGVFHIPGLDRAGFAAQVARLLRVGGRWLSLVGSTEGAARDTGPPRISARDIATAVEPVLEIARLEGRAFRTNAPDVGPLHRSCGPSSEPSSRQTTAARRPRSASTEVAVPRRPHPMRRRAPSTSRSVFATSSWAAHGGISAWNLLSR